jgi:hypothetical protein
VLVSVFGSGNGDRSLRAHDYNFFFQDDWKVTRKLTLNLGLRYELDLPPYDTRGRLATFDPTLYRARPLANTLQTGLVAPLAGFVEAGNAVKDSPDIPNVGKRVVHSIDPNNFAPRLGFAYTPTDKLVVRGGYGVFYSRTSFQYLTLNVIAPPTYVFGARLGAPLVGAVLPISDPFFPAPPQSAFPTLVPGVALSGNLFDRNIRTPFLHQYNASVQYQLARDLLLEAGYVGTRGLNLFRQVAINQARLASPQAPIVNEATGATITTNTPGNAAARAPFQGVGVNNFGLNQSTAQSSYNALQASLTKRFERGVQFLASYTWAKSIDNASGQGGGAGVGGVINPGGVGETSGVLGNQRDNRANRGVSDFDRTHRFVLSGLWELPGPKDGLAKTLLGGWQVAGIVTAMSGLPIDIVDAGAASLYGLNGSTALARPNFAPGATAKSARENVPAGYYFNPAAFVRPFVAAGQAIPSAGGSAVADASCNNTTVVCTDFGQVGRNILRGPRQTNVDFSVFKRFYFGETRNFEFRTEFFNLFNQVNLANPLSDLNAGASFGRIISVTTNPRIVQFAFKFNF